MAGILPEKSMIFKYTDFGTEKQGEILKTYMEQIMIAEIFKATSFDCPRCGEMLYFRKCLDNCQMARHPRVKCQSCGHVITKNDIILMRLRKQTTEGFSFTCDDCGRANFSFEQSDRCQYCHLR